LTGRAIPASAVALARSADHNNNRIIALNDAMILPYHANPDRIGFSDGAPSENR
jgi:hypothetical protein